MWFINQMKWILINCEAFACFAESSSATVIPSVNLSSCVSLSICQSGNPLPPLSFISTSIHHFYRRRLFDWLFYIKIATFTDFHSCARLVVKLSKGFLLSSIQILWKSAYFSNQQGHTCVARRGYFVRQFKISLLVLTLLILIHRITWNLNFLTLKSSLSTCTSFLFLLFNWWLCLPSVNR